MSEGAISTARGGGTPPAPVSGSVPTARPGADAADVVEIRLPASSAYLSVLRTATAGLAARLDFTLDEIEDLRIAVDEACAMLLPKTGAESELTCRFSMGEGALGVRVSAPGTPDGLRLLPAPDSFAWTVLTALAGDVDTGTEGGALYISLLKRRGLPATGAGRGPAS